MEDTKCRVKRVMGIISEGSRGKELGTGRKKKKKKTGRREKFGSLDEGTKLISSWCSRKRPGNRRWQTWMQIG